MRRRGFLAGLGAAALSASAGCAGVLGREPEWELRAMRADGNETDTVCDLSAAFVDAHPELAAVLSRADRKPAGEWASTPLRLSAGNELGHDLQHHCEGAFRGLYRYDGAYYFVSLRDVRPGNDVGHGGHDGHHHGNESHGGESHGNESHGNESHERHEGGGDGRWPRRRRRSRSLT